MQVYYMDTDSLVTQIKGYGFYRYIAKDGETSHVTSNYE